MNRTRVRRTAAVLAAALAGAALLTACEPPIPTFTADPTATGADATPGDRTCATAAGTCSLRAAVEEANALGRADVLVGPGTAAPQVLTITGTVNLAPVADHGSIGAVDVVVADGATAFVRRLELGRVTVAGSVVLRRVSLGSAGAPSAAGVGPLLDVEPDGRAVVTNTFVIGWSRPGVRNAGELVLHGSTVAASSLQYGPDAAAITTLAGASTTMGAVAVLGTASTAHPACGGAAPTSMGYNAVFDASCGLTAPGDVQTVAETSPLPGLGSARIDRVPVGALGCGAEWRDDITTPAGDATAVRPSEGDGQPGALCDIGAWEYRGPRRA